MRRKYKGKKRSIIRFTIHPLIIPITVMLFLVVTYVFRSITLNEQATCANSISCIKDLTGIYEEDEKQAVFMGKTIAVPPKEEKDTLITSVLGDNTKEKRIEVDLTAQRLYGLEGDTIVFDFPISSGKWGRTPTGTFSIWVKLRYTRMSGGNVALGTYYNLPNVPYVMFFYNSEVEKSRGFSIHGTYWHNNFGRPMSHGCINMRTEDVAKLYAWTNTASTGSITYAKNSEGTKVIVYGEAPLD